MIVRTAADFRSLILRRKEALRRAARPAMAEVGDLIALRINRLCPRGEGDLADTIEAKPPEARGDQVSVEVTVGEGLDSSYVASVEFGNHRQQPQPFIRPGFRQAADEAPDLVARRLAASL